jgi:8-amino-7-oxononanoate synthase
LHDYNILHACLLVDANIFSLPTFNFFEFPDMSMTSKFYENWIASELESLEANNMLRGIPDIDFGADKYLNFEGRELINLASNDYLGLSGKKELRDGAIKAVETYGCGSAASRLVTGNFAIYDQLESRVAEFNNKDASIFFPAGYSANLAIMDTFADRHTIVFSDRLNHASILDGIRLSGARQVRYRHNDMVHLRKMVDKYSDISRKILVTDTIFSMDGDLAHLEEIVQICSENDIFLVIDEAHADGVFGDGRGLAGQYGLEDEVDLHMGAFSKSFGSLGGYVAGKAESISLLRNYGRSFVFTTALPPAVIGANLASLEYASTHPERGRNLLAAAAELRKFLKGLGFDTGCSQSQIIPVILGENTTALAARDFLIDKGLYCAAIRPPTVPQNTARLRLSIRADFNKDDFVKIKDAFADLSAELSN